ncbi:hypothetical protein KUTeg_004727 [Tegillarca granosa]|uniref:Uncharacterized protein n=1 Tax=Tegillarca granosa TaxID=220873 RepID=A0ABQ9FHP0_TEGGR|nr:hypothetical protein KUTeg_004727 [Tegillarca granosa]
MLVKWSNFDDDDDDDDDDDYNLLKNEYIFFYQTIMTEALQSGKDAAHFIIKKYKENFEFNDTHPRIEAFDPQLDELELAETSELALLECIKKKKVEDAINMHKNCMERGMDYN